MMHGNSSGGSSIGSLIEAPIISGVPPAESLFQGEVRLDPCDSGQFDTVPGNNTPEIGMLALAHDPGVEKESETIRHIPAIGEDVHSSRRLRQDLSHSHDFGSLGGLPLPANWARET